MNNKVIAAIGSAAVLALAASSACAAVYNIGTITEPSGTFGAPIALKITGSALPFKVDIEFTLPYQDQLVVASLSASTAILVAGAHPPINIQLTNGNLELFAGVPGSGVPVSGESGPVMGSNQFYGGGLPPDVLGAGTYYLEFTGLYAPQIWNGSNYVLDTRSKLSYNGTISITSVLEPSTWAMMLVGFAGLGLAGYQRVRGERAALV